MGARVKDEIELEPKELNIEVARDSLMLLYEVGREFAAALDLRTVLHRVLFLSMKYVGAISGSIIVLDDHGQPVESAFLIPGKEHDHTALQLRVTYERGLAGWVAKHKRAVLVLDTSKDKRWLRRPDDSDERTGAKSAVSAPIMVREQLVGVITLVHPQPDKFTDDHLDLVKAIADQAGIAVLNARLYAESQRQARVMTAVAESAAAINVALQLDEVLQLILEQISQALQVEGASLALVDIEKGELEFLASTLKMNVTPSRFRVAIGDGGIAGWVAQNGESVVVADTNTDERFSYELDNKLGIERKCILCVPIRSEGQIIGVIEVDNPADETFDADDLQFLAGIGEIAGTAIRHAQLFERQQAAHRRYRELFEDSIDPIIITDRDGNILEANRQAENKLGLKKRILLSRKIRDIHLVDDEKIYADFSNITPGNTISYESVLYTRIEDEIPIEVYVRIVEDKGVPNIQWIMIGKDDSEFESLFSIALRSTERIQRLTDSLLDINRLEAGQPVGNRQILSPGEIVADAIDAVISMADGKDIEIIVNLKEDLPNVNVDADMIRRVMINLLENAIKFTTPGGKIWTGVGKDNACVLFWVEDNGPGIPSKDRDRIFDKFTRLGTKRGGSGFGLGLAFCRLAILGHGGQIWVESVTGSGAKFQFLLQAA
jgi:PAS domain S-box-containing protein